MSQLWRLFGAFARIGGLTFGGGYAMLPMLQEEIVERRKWASEEELLDYYAIGQCTPGIIAVNTATFIGHKIAGFWGAVFATVGVIFPSVVIILLIAAFLQNFADLAVVGHAFAGIRVAVSALIVNAVVRLWKAGVRDAFGAVWCIIVFVLSTLLPLSPVVFVLSGALAGILAMRWNRQKEER